MVKEVAKHFTGVQYVFMATNPIASVVGRRASRIFETLFDRRQDDAAKALLADLTAALDRAERSALGPHECAECCGNGTISVGGADYLSDPSDVRLVRLVRCRRCAGSGACLRMDCARCADEVAR